MVTHKSFMSHSAFEGLRPHFNILARLGYFKLVPRSENEMKNNLHFAYRVLVWTIVGTYILQHFIRLVQFRHSPDQLVNTLFILLTILACFIKHLAFNVKSKRIDHIISVMSGQEFSAQNEYHLEAMRSNARTMLQVLGLYMVCTTVCGALWTAFPIVNMVMGEEVVFTGYFPFDTDEPFVFFLAVAWMNVFITFQAWGNVAMDCTIIGLYAQAKVQLQILRHNLEHLADSSEDHEKTFNNLPYKDDDLEFRRVVHERFEQCVLRHQKIKWFVRETEAIFAEALAFVFFVQAWVICMTVYKIVDLNLFTVEFVSIAVYLIIMLAELYIYCYYGTQVKYESEQINQSVYLSSWLRLSPRFRRHLLIMMESLKRPIAPRTAYIIPISLDTYIAVLRSSYTLFTFLDRSRQ